jgi:chromosome segregation ATPase
MEVENILNEIRERVRRDHRHDEAPAATSTSGTGGGRQALSINSNPKTSGELERVNSESLNRLAAYLTTTSRAWDRLPPLYSNRKGGAARVEVWLKARLKAMSRWFIWEQVNFNSAVHHALAETLHTLSAYQQELAALRGELAKHAETSREGFEQGKRELAIARAALEDQTVELRNDHANLSARNAAVEARIAVVEARGNATEERSAVIEKQIADTADQLTRKIDEARASLTPLLAELAGEFRQGDQQLRESDMQLREEQRVCFKQLSLEASETALNEERGRRLIETRLAELEKALTDADK